MGSSTSLEHCRLNTKAYPPRRLSLTCLAIFLLLWAAAATRHALLQSNAYDLGLFDQWIWLASQGLPPYSSMEGVHLLADHGAWALYLAALPYHFHASVQWLLASQAAGLSLTALPLWWVGRQAGLTPKLCWLICALLVAAASGVQRQSVRLPPRGVGDAGPGGLLLGQSSQKSLGVVWLTTLIAWLP